MATGGRTFLSRVLGPLEVRDDGRSLALAGAKQRALLALLLVHANRVLSRDRLIDEEDGPGTGSSLPRPRPRRGGRLETKKRVLRTNPAAIGAAFRAMSTPSLPYAW